MKQLFTLLCILSLFLAGCTRTAYEFNLFREYDVQTPEVRKSVKLKRIIWKTPDDFCYLKSDDLISYSCEQNPTDYTITIRDKKGTWRSESHLFFWTLISLGLIPSYEKYKETVEVVIHNNTTGLEITEDIGTKIRTDWIGWIPMFIPDGNSFVDAIMDKNDEFTSNIAYHVYDKNSSLGRLITLKKREQQEEERKQIAIQKQRAKERLEKENKIRETLDDDIENMLNGLKK